MPRHAYLIIAHDNPLTLRTLLAAIDDPRNDVFLHLDRRSALWRHRADYATSRATLRLVESRRVDWGAFSQIDCELRLFAEARRHGPYAYYHLLSGVDLPLHSQDFIHDFFALSQGTEYIGFCSMDEAQTRRRAHCYNVFQRHLRHLSLPMRLVQRLVDTFVHINKGVAFRKGPNWVSVTEACVDCFLHERQWVERTFRHSMNGDELWKQTLLMLHPELLARVPVVADEYRQCLREIDWQRGTPYTWRPADLPQLGDSRMMFARKFSDENRATWSDFVAHLGR